MTTTITILSLFPNISAPTVASPADTVLSEFTYVDTRETILIYTTHCASDDNVFQQRKCKIWCLNGTLTVYILYNLHKYKPHLCMQSVSSTVMLKLKKPHVTGKHLCTYNEHNQQCLSTEHQRITQSVVETMRLQISWCTKLGTSTANAQLHIITK